MTEQQIVVTLATKVMGWSKEQIDFLYPAWNPLQNIADAWQVVEQIMKQYFLFDLMAGEDGWIAVFKQIDTTFIHAKEWEGTGDTAQAAICDAAYQLVA